MAQVHPSTRLVSDVLLSHTIARSSFNIFLWGIVLCCHAACKNFAGLLVVRLLLGASEGCITAGFLITSSMFYTRAEHLARVGFWCKIFSFPSLQSDPDASSDGSTGLCACSRYPVVSVLIHPSASIMASFIGYGVLHITSSVLGTD